MSNAIVPQLEEIKTHSAALQRPHLGWICAVRDSLGMTVTQAARRMGITRAGFAGYEQREKKGSITLAKLSEVADSLGCELVYGFVPKDVMPEQIRRNTAEEKAATQMERVKATMALEGQIVSEEETLRQTQDLVEMYLADNKSLWS